MQRPVLILHGGAGPDSPAGAAERQAACASAYAAGWSILAAKGHAVDAVTAVVAALEDAPLFIAGVGSCLTHAGTVEMDASIMDGRRLAAGAVAAVSTALHPIHVARAVMDDGRHVLLAGAGADSFARACGLPLAPSADHVITPRQRQRWADMEAADGGTVGAVACDVDGHVAAATSTGGLMHKLPGRVGDSAIIGAGTFADAAAGAASATGTGEAIIRVGLAKAAVDRLRDGRHPRGVARAVIDDLTARLGAAAGIIVVDRFGRIGYACNTASMLVAWGSASAAVVVADVGTAANPLAGACTF